MQTINVPYKGMMPTPDDYLCEDGIADIAVNLEMRNGGWHAIRQPRNATFFVEGFYPRYIHHTSDGKTFVFGLVKGEKEDSSGSTIYTLTAYTFEEEPIEFAVKNAPTADNDEAFGNFCSVGNIVNLTINGEIMHILYIKGGFRKVSHVPPFVPILFTAQRYKDNVSMENRLDGVSLSSTVPNSVECILGGVDYPYNLPSQFQDVDKFTDNELSAWYKTTESYSNMFNACFGQHNTIRKRLLKDGALMYPILLRYALKLYDGSYIQASDPILIFPVEHTVECVAHPCTGGMISHNGYEAVSWPDDLKYHFKSRPFNYECYKIYFDGIGSDQQLEALQSLIDDYGDIVMSVDFFLSEELYTIDTAEMDIVVTGYQQTELAGRVVRKICSPQFKERNLSDAIEGVSTFYKVKSIKPTELKNYMANCKPLLDKSSDTLENYTEFDRLDVGSVYDSTGFCCNGMRVYNNRLLAYGIGSNYPDLQRLTIMTPLIENAEDTLPDVYGKYLYPTLKATSSEVEIEDNTHADNIVIRSAESFNLPIFFFYQNSRAKNFYMLNDEGETDIVRKMELTEHPLLNGMYYYKNRAFEDITGWGGDDWGTQVSTYPDETANVATLNYANQVKASEVNNPFTFKDGNSASCGAGKVLALATNAQAVSTGQFGQYPILAFCSDGVFAIGVGTNGTLQTCSPYSLDIISNADSVASVTGMVTCVTPNGLIGLGSSGSRKVILPGDKNYPIYLDAVQRILTAQNIRSFPYEGSAPDLHAYLTTGVQTAYDYPHNRLLLFNPNYAYTYVCDMDTFSWSVHTEQFMRALNEPDKCYLVDKDGMRVWDYSADDICEQRTGWILTRPCKFGAHDMFKTVSAVAQRGYFGERNCDAVQHAILGSENLYNWYLVRTSASTHMRNFRGTPYKAFRVLAMCKDWTQELSLSAASIVVEGRMNDQVR